jgi:hypothetical protein
MFCLADFNADEDRTSARASVLASEVEDGDTARPLEGDIVVTRSY